MTDFRGCAVCRKSADDRYGNYWGRSASHRICESCMSNTARRWDDLLHTGLSSDEHGITIPWADARQIIDSARRDPSMRTTYLEITEYDRCQESNG